MTSSSTAQNVLPRDAVQDKRQEMSTRFADGRLGGGMEYTVLRPGSRLPALYGSANTYTAFTLGGFAPMSVFTALLTSELPVLTATYCLPFTANVTG